MATAHVLRTLPDAELGYVRPWGASVLREQLARYLARTRHISTDADGVIVTSGVTQALTLLCRVLHARGHRTLAVEDPSNAIQRQVLSRYGLRILNVPVDGDGIDVEALARTGTRAVLVTPAHQYPTGVAMSTERRAALLAWAASCDGLVVEDDYDAEFQPPRRVVPSLQGAGPDHVAHVSSVSKTLAPGIRLGWLVPPPSLRQDVLGAKRDDDFGSGVIGQHVLAHLVATGAYDRHLRRQRVVYGMRRDALVGALAGALPDWRVRGTTAGLHLWLCPPGPFEEAAVVQAAVEREVLVLGMSSMCREATVEGLVLGSPACAPRTRRRSRRGWPTASAPPATGQHGSVDPVPAAGGHRRAPGHDRRRLLPRRHGHRPGAAARPARTGRGRPAVTSVRTGRHLDRPSRDRRGAAPRPAGRPVRCRPAARRPPGPAPAGPGRGSAAPPADGPAGSAPPRRGPGAGGRPRAR
jgi:GntR family transcriptional regulator/MocR family aminotransferase